MELSTRCVCSAYAKMQHLLMAEHQFDATPMAQTTHTLTQATSTPGTPAFSMNSSASFDIPGAPLPALDASIVQQLQNHIARLEARIAEQADLLDSVLSRSEPAALENQKPTKVQDPRLIVSHHSHSVGRDISLTFYAGFGACSHAGSAGA